VKRSEGRMREAGGGDGSPNVFEEFHLSAAMTQPEGNGKVQDMSKGQDDRTGAATLE
jgi:hypothetical protein